MGGRIVGAVVLKVIPKRFGLDVFLQQLHSTKGWKPPHIERWRGLAPVVGAFHWVGGCGPNRPSSDFFRYYDIPRALLRHGWYRRKVRRFGSPQELEQLAAWEMEKRREELR